MRGTLTGGSVSLLRYPAMLPCFSRLWGMILHCRKSPCRLEITADSRGLASGFSCLGDHPRVCGEHGDGRRIAGCLAGSSPRMRGTRGVGRAVCGGLGIIPAYAGNTTQRLNSFAVGRDRPRVCGEHRPEHHIVPVLRGSSPRMRGTLQTWLGGLVFRGIIPAYAGNTTNCGGCRNRSRDHPRVCGEHATGASTQVNCTGSSPRMRGTPAVTEATNNTARIIPAYAGNTGHCPSWR